MGKKISVIIPVYNTEKYVERSIRSVLNQIYQNMEVICVDDGSTDRSGMILDQIAEEDERMVVIHKVNEGVSAARNLALEKATGEYIGFVDSDDYINPAMYFELVSAIEKSEADIATCNYYMAYASHVERAMNGRPVPETPVKIRDFLIYIYERDVYKGVAGYLWTRLFRSTLIKEGKGNSLLVQFDNRFLGADDVAFVADVNMRAKTIVYVDKPLYYYYQREGSIVHDEQKQFDTFFWIKAYEYLIEKYTKHGVNENVLDMIKRMYVFRCGKLLEIARNMEDKEKTDMLSEKIRKYLEVYVRTNLNQMERVKWIVDMMV